ncbi:MAG: PD-(D/E)XK nuclease family protein, partial [Acidobacteriota bacterium]
LASETTKEPLDQEVVELASAILSDFYAGKLRDTAQVSYLDRIRTGTVLARELPFYLVHNHETWNGVIDLVLEEDGVIRAIDYKSTMARDPLPERYRQQQTIYTEALQRALPGRNIDFEFWWLGRAES